MKTTLTALVLTLLPGLALAQDCSGKAHQDTAMSCAEGHQLDTETGTCVPTVTG